MSSENVIVILQKAERWFRCLPDFEKNKAEKIFLKLFDEIPENTFASTHMVESEHRLKIIRSIIISFMNLRFHHLARSRSASHVTSRHRLTRSIIFRSE